MAVVYRVYVSTPAAPPGNSVDYSAVVATVTAAPWSWTGPAIPAGTVVRYAVLAFDTTVGGLENPDISSTVTLSIAADGSDLGSRPPAPTSTSAAAGPAGAAQVSWSVSMIPRSRWPTGFRVYGGAGTPDYATPLATIAARPYEGLAMSRYFAAIPGLAGGTAYAIAVRGYNAAGEGASGPIGTMTASTAGPAAIDAPTAVATGRVDR